MNARRPRSTGKLQRVSTSVHIVTHARDKDFPPPERIIWTEHRNTWVQVPQGVREYEQSPDGPPIDLGEALVERALG